MAGGIFTDRPFEPNIKCIIFSVIMILAYLYISPEPNYALLPLIFIFAYVGMAWYDYLYRCDVKMYSGKYGIAAAGDSIFKPQRREGEPDLSDVTDDPRQATLIPDQERAYLEKVYAFHLLFVMGPLIYAGYKGPAANKMIYGYLFGLGTMAGLYHAVRLFLAPRETGNPTTLK